MATRHPPDRDGGGKISKARRIMMTRPFHRMCAKIGALIAILMNTVYCFLFAPHIKMFIIGGMMNALVGTLLGFIIGIVLGRFAVAHGFIEYDYLAFNPKRGESGSKERVVTLIVLLLVFGLPCFILLGLSCVSESMKATIGFALLALLFLGVGVAVERLISREGHKKDERERSSNAGGTPKE